MDYKFNKEEEKRFYSLLLKTHHAVEYEKRDLKNEGIGEPNRFSIECALDLLGFCVKNGLYVNKVATSVEEGMYLSFSNNEDTFIVEVYNDGVIGYMVVGSDENVLYNEDLKNTGTLKAIVSNYFKL